MHLCDHPSGCIFYPKPGFCFSESVGKKRRDGASHTYLVTGITNDMCFRNSSNPSPTFLTYFHFRSGQVATFLFFEVTFLKKYLFLFVYLAALGLSHSMWEL